MEKVLPTFILVEVIKIRSFSIPTKVLKRIQTPFFMKFFCLRYLLLFQIMPGKYYIVSAPISNERLHFKLVCINNVAVIEMRSEKSFIYGDRKRGID